MARPGARRAASLLQRLGLTVDDLGGVRFAVNVGLATTIVWTTLQAVSDTNPIWAIASMVAAADPQPHEAVRIFKCRLTNVLVGSVVGLVFVSVGGTEAVLLPFALATAVLVSSYIVRVKTMWRQAPITAAIVIAAAIATDSPTTGIERGIHKVAEVVFGCVVGVAVSLFMSKVWLIQPDAEDVAAVRGSTS